MTMKNELFNLVQRIDPGTKFSLSEMVALYGAKHGGGVNPKSIAGRLTDLVREGVLSKVVGNGGYLRPLKESQASHIATDNNGQVIFLEASKPTTIKLADTEVSYEDLGRAIHCHINDLTRKLHTQDEAGVKILNNLEAANKRIAEQTKVIEQLNATITKQAEAIASLQDQAKQSVSRTATVRLGDVARFSTLKKS